MSSSVRGLQSTVAQGWAEKSEIEQRKLSLMSIMPQGLLDNFTRAEIAALAAYVAAHGDPSSPLVQPPSVRADRVYD